MAHQETDIATLVIDFSDMDSVRVAADEALNRFPAIDGLVLSVGAFIQDGPDVLPSGRMQQLSGLVLHVIARFHETLDWDDLESLKSRRPMDASNRTKCATG